MKQPLSSVAATLLLLTVGSFFPPGSLAEITPGQRRQLQALETAVAQAGRLYLQKKFAECGNAVGEIQKKIEEIAADGDPQLLAVLEPIYARVAKAHALLETQGISLPPLKQPGAAPKPTDQPGPPAGDEVVFSKHVAPILVSKCGRCHVSAARGEFSMTHFAALMKGTPDGKVVLAGDAVGSRIIEVIVEGDMPRGGLKVTPQELDTLKTWIANGAKYDAADPQTPLASLTSAQAGELAKLEVKQATGKETVSFANDIAPVLDKNCSNCHGRGDRPSGRLNLLTFAGLLRGGESGPPIVPGKPADSLLVQKLKGTGGGERMPLQRPPLADDTIAKIEKWIEEGATFDGPDSNQDIRQVANLAKAERATHEELAAERAEIAGKNWQLGMPGIDSDRVETKNFLLLGNIGPATLQEHADRAEAVLPKVAEVFGLPTTDKALVKGRITLFAFKQRYDYSEYGKMVERRDLPSSWRGHWRYNIIDAYGAFIPSRRDAYSDEALIAQQVAGVLIASQGEVPAWFAEGAARVAAERIAKDDSRVRHWNDQLAELAKRMAKPDDFLTGNLSPEEANIAAFSFVKFLMTDMKRFGALLAAVRDGASFDAAFKEDYGGTPAEVAVYWQKRAGRRTR